MTDWLAVIDRHGSHACGQLAFYVVPGLSVGDVLSSQTIRWPDSRAFISDDGQGTTGQRIVCAFCKGSVDPRDILAAAPLTPAAP